MMKSDDLRVEHVQNEVKITRKRERKKIIKIITIIAMKNEKILAKRPKMRISS